jgi:hypothetical protein
MRRACSHGRRWYTVDHNKSRMNFETSIDKKDLDEQLKNMFNVLHERWTKSNDTPISEYLLSKLGFYCFKAPSSVKNAGHGVYVRTNGVVDAGKVVSIYSGTVYARDEPTFIPSIGNKFMLQRKDSYLIDGNDRYISKIIHKSCCRRERYYHVNEKRYIDQADDSWLKFYYHKSHQDFINSGHPSPSVIYNPYAIGHYINSSHDSRPSEELQTQRANVMYYEYEFDRDEWPIDLLRYTPNVHYNPQTMYLRKDQGAAVKSIVLIALRELDDGEELFASYKNLVYSTKL